ncbi:MAG: hypothetical protein M3400_08575 [Actinomycetota bacterium]|nr:hypothetical protein [Actinomycetota bacterium]
MAWRAGFDVPSLADCSRTSGRTGLVVGFGRPSDAEFGRALGVLTASLARHCA